VLLCKNERPCWTCEILVWACEPQQLTLVTVNFPKRGTYLFMYIILKRCIGILKEYLGKMRCFAPSPYNLIKMALIAEEVIRGNRTDPSNPFHWEKVRLNLPGSAAYEPTISWICKIRADDLVACELFTFVDDEREGGQSGEVWPTQRCFCLRTTLQQRVLSTKAAHPQRSSMD
jgi:hypothetical protein